MKPKLIARRQEAAVQDQLARIDKPSNGSGFGKRPQHSLAQQITALG
ncbi:MAG: hypothetical protein IH906_04685 [Proteobacteria bacterium]|nr:hypothetical protein [Pseudomonadota bacterium]